MSQTEGQGVEKATAVVTTEKTQAQTAPAKVLAQAQASTQAQAKLEIMLKRELGKFQTNFQDLFSKHQKVMQNSTQRIKKQTKMMNQRLGLAKDRVARMNTKMTGIDQRILSLTTKFEQFVESSKSKEQLHDSKKQATDNANKQIALVNQNNNQVVPQVQLNSQLATTELQEK